MRLLTTVHAYIHTHSEACLELSLPNNGRIMLTPGNHSLNLSLGSVATHSCQTGFVLVGQTTRVCEATNGETVGNGIWSGSAPTCEGGSCMMSDLIYNSIYIVGIRPCCHSIFLFHITCTIC